MTPCADACGYRYDAEGRLTRLDAPGLLVERFWRGHEVANALRTSASGDTQLTWLRAEGQPIVEQVSGAVSRMTLLTTAISGSVLIEADSTVRTVAYAPHGSRPDGDEAGAAKAEPAFNGEPLDAGSGCYLLGAGHHRPYSPTLGLFLAPDSASPFGAGGLNGLSYCAGDPVNRTDPTGHFWKWAVAALGIVAGVAAIAMSWGAASGAVTAVMAGGIAALTKSGAAAVAAVSLGAASIGVEAGAIAAAAAGDSKAAGILGWVGFGLGVVGMAPGIAKAAANGAAKLSRFSQRIGRIRTQGLSGRGSVAAGKQMAPPQLAAKLQVGETAAIGKSQLAIDDFVHVFQGHGAAFATSADGIVDARTLGRQIRHAAGVDAKINRVELQACFSATGGKYASQAQGVANELRVPTSGFKGVMDAGEPLERARVVGERYIFEPQQGFARMRTTLLNSSLHYVTWAGLRLRRMARAVAG